MVHNDTFMWYVMLRGGSEAQRGDSDSVAVARYNVATASLWRGDSEEQRGDSESMAWR